MSTLSVHVEMTAMTMQTENATYDEGREAQYREMMQQLAQLQQKYKGVRGELLAKVRDELMRLKPSHEAPPPSPPAAPVPPPSPARAARPTPPDQMLPSCRVCGRGMKLNENEKGTLICARGHTRLMT